MKKIRLNESRSASSRNALKHGFAARRWGSDDGRRISALTDIFKEGKSGGRIEETAKRAAAARSYLEEVLLARDKLLSAVYEAFQSTETGDAGVERSNRLQDYYGQLRRLERYEKQATVRWERAVVELEAAHLDPVTEAD
jgi:hypothetical protein